jgi:hsp70-interacting protein
MADPGFNSLLKWGVENSESSLKDPNAPKGETKFDPAALARMMGGIMGPSDAELMKQSFEVLEYKEATHEEKVTAFENFEMLIENLDNANNMHVMGLWTKLAAQLENPDAELRALAAGCCKVAVQNNIKTQERVSTLHAQEWLKTRLTPSSSL